MTRPKTMAEAERLALEGNGESQDSQAILEAVKAEIGAGTVRTQLPGACMLRWYSSPSRLQATVYRLQQWPD